MANEPRCRVCGKTAYSPNHIPGQGKTHEFDPVKRVRIPLVGIKLFYDLVCYARRYCRCYKVPGDLEPVAGDVMDGAYDKLDAEAVALVGAGVIYRLSVGDNSDKRGWTWGLTPLGCNVIFRENWRDSRV